MKERYSLILLCTLAVGSLGFAGSLSDEEMKTRPRIRVASSPYPNVLFRSLKRPEFGEHHYQARLLRTEREVSRGHFYTKRGGFIDLAHLRKTIDWSAYLQASILKDLEAGKTNLVYTCSEPTRYLIRLRYPESVRRMTVSDRRQFQRALSIHLALYTSYTALTWHEMLTWYGYSAIPGVSEQESAFSYEDMYTHAVGISVARSALMDETNAFDIAVSKALRAELKRLVPLGRAETRRALEDVKGEWWRFGKSLKRYTDIGGSGSLRPWLVDAFPCDKPVQYEVPRLYDMGGMDLQDMIELQLEPNVRVGGKILKVLGREGGLIAPAIDFPHIMVAVRRSMEKRFGPGVCQAYESEETVATR